MLATECVGAPELSIDEAHYVVFFGFIYYSYAVKSV